MTLSPERARALAEQVVRAIVASSGTHCIGLIKESTVCMRVGHAADFEGMTLHERVDACQDIAALARSAKAVVTITIPEES